MPQPDAKTASKPEAKAEPNPDAKAGVAAALNTSLGDLLVAGLVKDPEDAGRVIAAAIAQIEAPNATAKTPETKAAPKAETEVAPKPSVKAKAPPDPTPQAAE